jgi:hypothetical protein
MIVHLATKRFQKKRSALSVHACSGWVETRSDDSPGARGQPFQSDVKGFSHRKPQFSTLLPAKTSG